jgi:vacuolar-type H+-ATPase subunit F/Vma7
MTESASTPTQTGPKSPETDEIAGHDDQIGSSKSSSGQQRSPSKEIAVIGDEDTVIGFSLAGIKHISIIEEQAENQKIMDTIKEFINIPEIGFMIITQKIAEQIRDDLEKLKLEKTLYPIIIELPDKHGEVPDRVDPIRLLIRRAIGMEVIKS